VAERAEELKREIDDTRDNLGVTLDAIGDRVSPGRIAERRVNRVRQTTGRLREKVMGTHGTSAPSYGSSYGTYGYEAEGSSGPGLGEKARNVGGTVTGTVSDTASSVTDRVGTMAGSVTGTVQDAPQMLTQSTQGNPLLAGALAFGLGAFVASLLPSTEAEQSVAGSIAEPLKSQAQEMGKEVASTAKDTAQDAMESTKQVVADAKDEVSSEAAGAAQQVKGEAASAKDRISDTAQSGSNPTTPGSAY